MNKQQIETCFAYGWAIIVCAGIISPAVHAGGDKTAAVPKGAEKAVAAVRSAFARVDDIAASEPKGFGGSGGKGTPLFWSVRFQHDGKKQELSVTPEGVIIRMPQPVAVKDLPRAVAAGVAKAAPTAIVQNAVKNEMRATLKYVALGNPIVRQYAVVVNKDGKQARYVVSLDGKSVRATGMPAVKKAARPAKEFEVPAKAKKAVKALQALYPDLAVKQITHEVFDDGTGELGILTYEVEFVTKGTEREMVASPEGVIPHLWAPVEVKSLPKAVTAALEKAAPGATIARADAFEIRAALRFGALATPKVYYTVQVTMDGNARTLKFKPDGSVIKGFAFPKKR